MKNKKADKAAPKLPQCATIVFSGRTRRVRVPQKMYVYKQKTTSGWMSSLWCAGRVREPTAAGGRCSEAEMEQNKESEERDSALTESDYVLIRMVVDGGCLQFNLFLFALLFVWALH